MLYHGDFFELAHHIESNSVDLVICDLPFGITQNQWDDQLDMDRLWQELLRVGLETTPFLFFASGKFIHDVLDGNPEMFKYDLVWNKGVRPTGYLNANRMPMRYHELILVFYHMSPTYNPQKRVGHTTHSRGNSTQDTATYGSHGVSHNRSNMKYPGSIIEFERPRKTWDSTQKPLDLMEWLVRTYSNEGDTVLDPTFGTGTTAVACQNTGREFVGMELREEMVKTAQRRLERKERVIKRTERIRRSF